MHEKVLEAKEKLAKEKEEKIKMVKEAQEYIDSKMKEVGGKYISIRIRDGFIGKELSKDGKVLQMYRKRPRGTFVAMKDEKNKSVKIGVSYLNPKDKDIPIVGIKKAMEDIFSGETSMKKVYMSKNDLELLEFFKIRAMCYFWPELYSHSRGTEKIEYPNYEKIHKNIKRALGE